MTKRPSELIGESLREIGILMLVFVPLDALLQPGASSPLGYRSDLWWNWGYTDRRGNLDGDERMSNFAFSMLVFGAACAALIIWGIYEKARERKEENRDPGHTPHKTA